MGNSVKVSVVVLLVRPWSFVNGGGAGPDAFCFRSTQAKLISGLGASVSTCCHDAATRVIGALLRTPLLVGMVCVQFFP